MLCLLSLNWINSTRARLESLLHHAHTQSCHMILLRETCHHTADVPWTSGLARAHGWNTLFSKLPPFTSGVRRQGGTALLWLRALGAKTLAQITWILITVTRHVLFHVLILWLPRLTDLLSIVILTGLPTCYLVAQPHTSRINLSLVILAGVPLLKNSCPQIGIWPNLCKLLMLEHHPPELLPLQLMIKFQLRRCQVYLHTSPSPTRCVCHAKNNSSLKHRGYAGVKPFNGLPKVFLKLR